MTKRYFKSDMKFLNNVAFTLAICATTLSGCKTADMLNTSETINQGYVVDQETLALAPVGSSREQVLLSLGTPSTTATFDNEVFYYISQKRQRPVAFMKPKLIDQLRLHEGDRALALLRNVIEHFVVEGRRCRGRSQ